MIKKIGKGQGGSENLPAPTHHGYPVPADTEGEQALGTHAALSTLSGEELATLIVDEVGADGVLAGIDRILTASAVEEPEEDN